MLSRSSNQKKLSIPLSPYITKSVLHSHRYVGCLIAYIIKSFGGVTTDVPQKCCWLELSRQRAEKLAWRRRRYVFSFIFLYIISLGSQKKLTQKIKKQICIGSTYCFYTCVKRHKTFELRQKNLSKTTIISRFNDKIYAVTFNFIHLN